MAGDYDVGYGKPPKRSQFRKGQSGNLKGRPKGARALKTDLRAELSQRIRVTENGKNLSLTKQQLIIKALVAKAGKGDTRAMGHIFSLILQAFGLEGQEGGARQLHPDDQAILDTVFKRIEPEASDEDA